MTKEEPILMIEGIDVRELGEVFSGYYLNNPEEVTKIINLFRNQKEKEMLDDEITFLESIDKLIDIDLDKIEVEQYSEFFRIVEEVNKYGRLVKERLLNLKEKK